MKAFAIVGNPELLKQCKTIRYNTVENLHTSLKDALAAKAEFFPSCRIVQLELNDKDVLSAAVSCFYGNGWPDMRFEIIKEID